MTYDPQKRLHVHHIVAFFVMQTIVAFVNTPLRPKSFVCFRQRLLRLGLGLIYSISIL